MQVKTEQARKPPEPAAHEEFPPRTPLYHLSPLNAGSPRVESLLSYATPLAQAHSVRLQDLLEYVLTTAKTGIVASRLMRNHGFSAFNGATETATAVADALAQCTGWNDLRKLTLLPWRDAFRSDRAQSERRRRCPDCIRESRAKGLPVCEPLIWIFSILSHCPQHRMPLCEVCPH